MFFNDNPITTKENDILGRKNFAAKLADAILSVDASEGLCIGISGEWGSGKTSFINMIIEHIKRGKYSAGHNKPVIIQFNPWNIDTKEKVASQFLFLLSDKLGDINNNDTDRVKSAVNTISKYALSLSSFSPSLTAFKPIIDIINKGTSTEQSYDLTKQRETIIENLRQLNQKVIVVIDDIDRLSKEEICSVFQLVSATAKFPNIIYILSYDHRIAAESLRQIHNIDGSLYLEKIIQVPISIPMLRAKDLCRIFKETLFYLSDELSITFDKEYLESVFEDCVSGNIQTIRDVYRIINSLRLKCMTLKDEVNFVDLMVLTIIEQKYPDLYRWIRINKGALLSEIKEQIKSFEKNDETVQKEFRADLEKCNPENYEKYFLLIQTLFPQWLGFKGIKPTYEGQKMRAGMHLGQEDYYDRYFSYDLSSDELSRLNFDRAISEMSFDELCSFVKYVYENDLAKLFIRELQASKRLRDDRKLMVAKAMLKNIAYVINEEKAASFPHTVTLDVCQEIYSLLLTVKEEEVYALLKDEICRMSYDKCEALAFFVKTNLEAQNHAEDGQSGDYPFKQLLTPEHLKECGKMFAEKISCILQDHDLLDLYSPRDIIVVFRQLDKDAFDDYMKSVYSSPLSILKYAAVFMHNGSSQDGTIWNYYDEEYIDIDRKTIMSAFEQCMADRSLLNMREDQLIRIVAYSLIDMAKPFKYVSDSDVRRGIEEINAMNADTAHERGIDGRL